MAAFLLSEAAFFCTLIMTYLFFLHSTLRSVPSPREVFQLPLVLAGTVCLLSSSFTIHLAEKALRVGAQEKFLMWFGATIVLGILFLLGTAKEWADLIGSWKLTIGRNLFGSTYFTLVGFHGAHVTVGLIVMSIMWCLARRRQITSHNAAGVEVISWYWHFVDAVWIVVFTVVYVVGR